MNRAMLAALIVTGFAVPAFAADETTAPAGAGTSAYTAQLNHAAAANQVRNLLAAQGYSNVSSLDRDANGYWTGTAVKDGKAVDVSVALPSKGDAPAAN
jgi:hypothetical protein